MRIHVEARSRYMLIPLIPRWPIHWDLNEVVSDRPVILVRVCGHAGVLNTKAMKTTGLIDSSLPEVLRNSRGEATGIGVEEALREALRVYNSSLNY